MPVYKRNRVWYYEFKINTARYKKAIPAAQSKADALQAEAAAKRQVFHGTYGKATGEQGFSKFAQTKFFTWADEQWSDPQQARYYVKAFVAHFGKRTFAEISSLHIEAYKLKLKKEPKPDGTPRSQKTINRHLAVLSRIFRLAIQQKVTDKNPVLEVQRFPEGEGRIRFLSEDEAARLLAELDNQPDHLRHFVLLAMHSGMRFSEIAKLHTDYLDWQGREIILPDPKSKRLERVPMNDFVCELLHELEATALNGWLLPNPSTKQPYTNLLKGFRKLFDNARLENFTFHCLRHSFATEAIDQGENITTVQAVLRHRDLRTTMKYVHVKEERRHQAVAKMGDFWKKVPNQYPSGNVVEFKTALNR